MTYRGNWQSDVLRDVGGDAQEGTRLHGTPPLGAAGPAVPGPAAQGGQEPDSAHRGEPLQQVRPEHHPAGDTAHTPAARPRQAPDATPVKGHDLVDARRRTPQHGEAVTSRALHTLRRALSSSAAREVARITRVAEVLQQPVTTGRQIAVTSIRGGAGKTTLTALLSATYAHYRQDPVLALEADPALGSLPRRLGAETLRWTTGDIADFVQPDMTLPDVADYLVQLPSRTWLLPASQGQIGAMLDSKAYERAVAALRRYFGVMVIDCETLPAEVARVAMSAAHARVLAAPATPEGVSSTYVVLQWLQGLPRRVIAGTVVVLTELSPGSAFDLDEAARKLRSTGAAVRLLPYDRHLAAGGGLRTELLARRTKEAATRIAADAFQLSQQRPVPQMPNPTVNDGQRR